MSIKTKEQIQRYRRTYYEKHGEKVRAKNRQYSRTVSPERRRQYMLQHRYGISMETYDEMVKAQSGACAICERVPKELLVVDHEHATGAVRGLLCRRCNLSIALIDDAEMRARALAYIGALA